MTRVPLHVVAGPARSGKSALIARMLNARERWLGMENARLAAAHPMLRPLPLGCPCCTARTAFQVGPARALRETRAERIFIELADPAHLGALRRVLGKWPLTRYVERARDIRLPEDAALAPEALERA